MVASHRYSAASKTTINVPLVPPNPARFRGLPTTPDGPGGFGGLTPALPGGLMPARPRDLELPDNGIVDRRGKGSAGGNPFAESGRLTP